MYQLSFNCTSWCWLKGKSCNTFDIIMSTIYALFKFWLGCGGAARHPPPTLHVPLLEWYFSVRQSHRTYGPPCKGSSWEARWTWKYEHIHGFTLSWACCLVSDMHPIIQQDQTEQALQDHVTPPTSPHWLVPGCELHIRAGIYRVIKTDCQGFNNLSYTVHLR